MMEKKEIGEKGDMLNFSVASRSLNITPDEERLKMYDEYPAKNKKQKIRHLVWMFVLLAPTVSLIMKGHPFWAIIPGIMTLWQVWSIFMLRNVKPSTAYEQGLLIGAVVTETSPLQIMAMAEVQKDEDAPVCWGLKRFTVKELPGHAIRIGERIPCAALFGAPLPFAGIWGEFEPHPACWGTGDPQIIKKAIDTIGETEWTILDMLTAKALENADIDKKYAYFNEDLSPRTDLQEKPEKLTKADSEESREDNPEQHLLVTYTEEEMDCIENHIKKSFGEYGEVFHEILSPDIHVDIVIIPPTEEHNFYTLVTMGMGARRMNIPQEFKQHEIERAEIMVTLPADWNIKSDEEKDYWPIRWLKILARLPITDDTWLGWGHSIPNGEPFAENTKLSGVVLQYPYTLEAEHFSCLLPNSERVNFYQMIPLYEEEMNFKIANDTNALFELFGDDFSHVVDLNRKNYC